MAYAFMVSSTAFAAAATAPTRATGILFLIFPPAPVVGLALAPAGAAADFHPLAAMLLALLLLIGALLLLLAAAAAERAALGTGAPSKTGTRLTSGSIAGPPRTAASSHHVPMRHCVPSICRRRLHVSSSRRTTLPWPGWLPALGMGLPPKV